MAELDLLSDLHKSTTRDYLARVNDPDYPKEKAASLAKKWGYEYWDGDRRINYGGYRYIPGRWRPVAEKLIKHYNLKPNSSILDIGCGKGFLLYEMKLLEPSLNIFGVDVSEYAVQNAKPEIIESLKVANAIDLPFEDCAFDLVISLNTLHNLYNYELEKAIHEINRVSISGKQYICVESYRNESEKTNLLYWQVTCEQFCTPEEWRWWFKKTRYTGDYSFIFFE